MTFKPGHFFRLIAATPEGQRKGYISKAGSAANAIRMIENGEINAEDVAGFQRQRAENIRLFKDVLTDGDFYFSEDKNHIIFGKKYDSLKHADGFIAVTLEIDDKGNLGPVSFHPRKFTDNLLQDKQIKWSIGDISSASPNDAAGKSAEKTSGFAKDTVSPSSANVNPDSEKNPENPSDDQSGKVFSLRKHQQVNPIVVNGCCIPVSIYFRRKNCKKSVFFLISDLKY